MPKSLQTRVGPVDHDRVELIGDDQVDEFDRAFAEGLDIATGHSTIDQVLASRTNAEDRCVIMAVIESTSAPTHAPTPEADDASNVAGARGWAGLRAMLQRFRARADATWPRATLVLASIAVGSAATLIAQEGFQERDASSAKSVVRTGDSPAALPVLVAASGVPNSPGSSARAVAAEPTRTAVPMGQAAQAPTLSNLQPTPTRTSVQMRSMAPVANDSAAYQPRPEAATSAAAALPVAHGGLEVPVMYANEALESPAVIDRSTALLWHFPSGDNVKEPLDAGNRNDPITYVTYVRASGAMNRFHDSGRGLRVDATRLTVIWKSAKTANADAQLR